MKRLFNIVSALSLVLCAVVIVLWARSGCVADVWTWGQGSREYWVRSDWGRFEVMSVSDAAPCRTHETSSGGYHSILPGPVTGTHELVGVRFARGRGLPGQIMGPTLKVMGSGPYWSVETYHPLLALVLAWPIVPWCLHHRRRQRAWKRLAAGLCVACGYDLRASEERCPECGRAVPEGGKP